ncbi:DUF4333 domain-containing protein [Phormidium sp. CLA17]|uniref:DUF4333 domain-containing protein n=1 Tax=Leptolyngbya sp. Cla-17 TaxID=2803751 RepID=UPI001490CBC0|nr:DUF4333 domain-containing protein [Leptolyngbya sp. Cla-17]MBM0740501.1 DUF4333 domain-containing protein [Leptolyngbya sp. Cla-17]
MNKLPEPRRFTASTEPELVLRREHRFNYGSVIGLCIVAIAGCANTVDHRKVANAIQQNIIKQGGTSVKEVTCPGNVLPQAGKTFTCVGEMDNGYTFTIPVKQQDARGAIVWDVPNAKGLINIPKLEASMQDAVASEIGTRPVVACGGVYRAVKPSEGFECQVAYKVMKPVPMPKLMKGKPNKPKPPIEVSQTEKILVTTDGNGNINWKRVLPGLATKS